MGKRSGAGYEVKEPPDDEVMQMNSKRIVFFAAMLLCLAAVFAVTVRAEEPATPEQTEYSKEFLDRVKKRITKVRLAIKRYQQNLKKKKGQASGEALAQTVKDYLRPADHPDIVTELLNILNKINDGLVQEACMEALKTVKEGPCEDMLIAKGVRRGKPQTRAFVIEALAKGDKVQHFTLFAEILKNPKENEIARAACARALGILRDARAVNVLISCDKDKSEMVKLAVIEALSKFDNESARQCIASMIDDDSSWRVRAAAIQASVEKKNPYAVGYLIVRLRKEKGRLFDDVLKALKAITGVWKGESISMWEDWFKRSEYANKGKIVLKPRKDVPGNYTKITYHGIRTHSKNVVFIIDTSASMKERCDPKALKGSYVKPDEKFVGNTRMELVKWELTRCILRLDSNTSFNIIAFSTDVRKWKKRSVFATQSNKKAAINWVKGLTPDGRTNTWGALLAAFGCRSFADGRFRANPLGDTIFLLTDGDPNEGELDDPDEILAGVKELNRYHKIVIHCIAVGRFNKAFMQKLAEENGGEFVDLGD